MQRSILHHSGIAAFAALAVAVAGCESTAVSPASPEAPLFSGGTFDDTTDPHVTVCVDAASPAGTYTFDRSADTGFGTFFVASPFTLSPGECVDVWKDDVGDQPVDPSSNVTVSQTGAPANTQLDDIVVGGNPQDSEVVLPSATVQLNHFHGAILTFVNSELPIPGDEGCTPGFWRQPQHLDDWAVDPSTTFNSVFGSSTLSSELTLLEAVWLRGGKENALGRHAAAAYLNALSDDVAYAYSASEVVDMVNAAFDGTAGVEETKDDLEQANEAGCPL